MIFDVAVFFEYIPKKTINKKGAKTVWVKCGGVSKNRATVMLLGDSDGLRYPPFVVFKAPPAKDPSVQAANLKNRCGFGKTVWREMKPLRDELNVQFHGNPKGLTNFYVFLLSHIELNVSFGFECCCCLF